jgi:hypothetical protein
MIGEHRDTAWRQGLIFHVPAKDGAPEIFGVIVSHDCDICADADVEPCIEYVKADLKGESNGSLTFGKNPRRLQAQVYNNSGEAINADFDIRKRTFMMKSSFFAGAIRFSHQLQERDVTVLQRWLAARYGRSAFPNAFEKLMGKHVQERIDRLSEKKGKSIRGLYFDLDDNRLIEREEGGDPYELVIYIVYPPDTDDTEAEGFAKAIGEVFKAAFFEEKTARWSGIQLVSCDAVSEDIFTLSLALSTKTWRVDHRSYKGSPAACIYPEPDR